MSDLFGMKRYWSDSGDEEPELSIQTKNAKPGILEGMKNQEIDILKKLKSKATNNKSISSEAKQDISQSNIISHVQANESIECEESSVLKSKKKKKRKRSRKLGEVDSNEGGEKGGFPVLGENLTHQWNKKKVRRSLPSWLENPNVISVDLSDQQMSVECLQGLDENTCNNLRKNNITHFFPVQRQVIPYMLANDPKSMYPPHDICVSAPTGSGKTLAYVLPIGT